MFSLILYKSLSILFYALVGTIVFYILILLILHRINKYSVRNWWFILMSFIILPFMLIELTSTIALWRVKSSIKDDAREYAVSFASKTDNYKSNAKAFVSDKIDDVVDDNVNSFSQHVDQVVDGALDKTIPVENLSSDYIPDSVEDAFVSVAETAKDVVKDSISSVTGKAIDVVENTAGIVKVSVENKIDNALDFLPDNPIAGLLNKYPVLAKFLDENEINGDSGEEIVSKTFDKIDSYLLSLILGFVKWICIVIAFFVGISTLFG